LEFGEALASGLGRGPEPALGIPALGVAEVIDEEFVGGDGALFIALVIGGLALDEEAGADVIERPILIGGFLGGGGLETGLHGQCLSLEAVNALLRVGFYTGIIFGLETLPGFRCESGGTAIAEINGCRYGSRWRRGGNRFAGGGPSGSRRRRSGNGLGCGGRCGSGRGRIGRGCAVGKGGESESKTGEKELGTEGGRLHRATVAINTF